MAKVRSVQILDARPLDSDELERLDRCWRATNYLSVGQIYLLGNPLLHEKLADEHVKPRLLGHWGTPPGLNLVYPHLHRVIASPLRSAPGRERVCQYVELHGVAG